MCVCVYTTSSLSIYLLTGTWVVFISWILLSNAVMITEVSVNADITSD